MARLTRLRRAAPGKIALEVDGRPWRTVPDEVVLRVGLVQGLDLDRPLLRRLRGELVRAQALEAGARALARRDLSEQRLRERLRRAGAPPAAERSAVASLARARLVDDRRLARARARALAERGWGDAAIADRLEREGIDEAEAAGALAELAPERERAAEAAGPADDRRRAARLLARRGFSYEAIEDALGALDEEP